MRVEPNDLTSSTILSSSLETSSETCCTVGLCWTSCTKSITLSSIFFSNSCSLPLRSLSSLSTLCNSDYTPLIWVSSLCSILLSYWTYLWRFASSWRMEPNCRPITVIAQKRIQMMNVWGLRRYLVAFSIRDSESLIRSSEP